VNGRGYDASSCGYPRRIDNGRDENS
jgi:hypothetical protein